MGPRVRCLGTLSSRSAIQGHSCYRAGAFIYVPIKVFAVFFFGFRFLGRHPQWQTRCCMFWSFGGRGVGFFPSVFFGDGEDYACISFWRVKHCMCTCTRMCMCMCMCAHAWVSAPILCSPLSRRARGLTSSYTHHHPPGILHPSYYETAGESLVLQWEMGEQEQSQFLFTGELFKATHIFVCYHATTGVCRAALTLEWACQLWPWG
jgi:hypothetical protein